MIRDATGVEILVGERVALMRPGGGVGIGRVESITDGLVARMGQEFGVNGEMRSVRWSEQVRPEQVLVLKE